MSIYFLAFSLLYFSSMLVFTLKRKHLLIMLMSLESAVVALFVGLYFLLSDSSDLFFLMVFLTMSVCEGALGLSLLVLMIRVHSNDFILTFSSLW